PIQLFHKAARIAPACFDLDKELEKNFGPYHLFDVEAGCGSNLLEHLSAFAEQDGLLPVAFAINHSGNPHQPRTLFKLFDQHRDRVRHLFMRLHQAGQQFIEPLLFEGGDGDDLLEIVQRLELRDQRQQLTLVGKQINFVEQQKDRSAGLFRQVEDEAVVGFPLFLGINDHQNKFAAFERLAYLRHHLASKRGAGTVNSGRVDQHDLPGFVSLLLGNVDDSENAVARGLGLRRNNGKLLAHQRIQQRALAGIGAAEDADESGVEGHEN